MALCHFTEKVKCSFNSGNVVGAVFLDLKKAFHTVSHEILVSKLRHHFNFSDLAVNWLSSHLEHRQQCVRLQNVKTSPLYVQTSQPQASVFSKDTDCRMYTDDTVFYVSAKNPRQASEILSRQVVTVSEWLQMNHFNSELQRNSINVFFNTKESH